MQDLHNCCTTVAALVSILFQLAANDGVPWTVRRHWLQANKKLSYCWETVRRESMPRIAEMDVEMKT